jgi:hypothetical protein
LKPYDFSDLVHLAKMIQEYWLRISKCPDSFRSPKPLEQTEPAEIKELPQVAE